MSNTLCSWVNSLAVSSHLRVGGGGIATNNDNTNNDNNNNNRN